MTTALPTEIIPLFPLSNVVLFPQAHCPLHIFEARYRQMMDATLAGARHIGMATVHPEHRAEIGGDPPLFSIGCLGEVQQARRRDDGRYDVVLFGTRRFRIVEEIPRDSARLYRLARVEMLDEPFNAAREGIPLQGLRADAIEVLSQLLRYVEPDSAHELDPRRFSGIDDTAFVSALCQMLDLPPAEKQGLLEADGPTARCERLVAILHFRLAELLGGIPGPSGSLHGKKSHRREIEIARELVRSSQRLARIAMRAATSREVLDDIAFVAANSPESNRVPTCKHEFSDAEPMFRRVALRCRFARAIDAFSLLRVHGPYGLLRPLPGVHTGRIQESRGNPTTVPNSLGIVAWPAPLRSGTACCAV